MSAVELSEAIRARTLSCREVMAAHLTRIGQRNGELNAIVSLRDHDELLAEADTADDELARGKRRGWMHGLPHAVKDMADTAGLRTTLGSPLFADRVPSADALHVGRMRDAGCIVIGKTNVPELGLGSQTFNEVFGVTRNPYDPGRTCGGSSGGAAVGLATRMLPVADGSDYMGSLRNPAGWCNVFGMRPSQGRVPAWPTLDAWLAQVPTDGPMGRTVLDLAMLLGTQAGFDARAPLSLDDGLDDLADVEGARRALARPPVGPRVGWLGDLDGHLATEAGVLEVCEAAMGRLEVLGGTVEPADLGTPPERVWEAWMDWRSVTVSASLAATVTSEEQRRVVKPEALWELDRGRTLPAAAVVRAAQVRTALLHGLLDRLEHLDALALPSAQVWPFPVEQRWPTHVAGREMGTYHRWMECTIYASFAGLPAISVPAGFDERGLPMGLQLIGRPRGDLELLRLAAAYETTIDHLHVGGA